MPSKLASMRVQLGLAGMLLALVSPLTPQSATGRNEWQLTSPNGDVTLQIRLADYLSYSVSYRGRQVIADSKLGLDFAGENSTAKAQLNFLSAKEGSSDTSWTNPFGKNNPVRDHSKQLELAFNVAHPPVRRMDLIFRA